MTRLAAFVLFVATVAPLFGQEVNRAGQPFPAVALSQPARGTAIIGALGQRLPEVARWYGVTEEELRALVSRDRSLVADRSGHLSYACSGLVPMEGVANEEPATVTPMVVYPPAQTFFLHSRLGANRKIYLDFDGHTTSGTIWNSNFNGGNNFTTPSYDVDGNTANFNSTELSRIQGIWKRVAEDFAPFEVDVTTEDPGPDALRRNPSTDQAYGIRVCVGGSSYDWYKRGAGGVAYIGSFNWNSDTPCFVFTGQLGNGNEKSTAEATSHEVGHTLGLNHDGQTNGTEYYTGHGNWAPIMGVGYSKEIVQWSQGEYSLANNQQDDTAVMQNFGAPLRVDDAGGTLQTATALNDLNIAVDGIIHTRADRDYFSFSTGAGPISFSTAAPSASPNLDVALTLYDVAGAVITTNDPATLTASLNATVPAGTYYLAVEGTAPGSPLTSYNDYGSLGGYELTGSIQSTAENFVSVVATDAEAAETLRNSPTNTGTFVFTRLVVNAQPLVVPFTIGGSALISTDYGMPTSVTIPARMATASITVAPADDALGEGSKTVTVTLNPSPNYSLANAKSATVTIRDNELPQVSLLGPTVPEAFENSATPLILTVHRSAKAPTPLTVNLLIGGSAEAGLDYETLPASVTFAPGEDKRELTLQPIDNAIFNATRTVTVAIAIDPEYQPAFQNSAIIRLLNDEPTPDPIKPAVTVSSPKLKQRFDAAIPSLIATGSATDNLNVARVRYRLNGGAWIEAQLAGSAWSAELGNQVSPGNNLLEAVAEDDDANASPIAAVTFVVVKPRALEVIVDGPGTVTPGTGTFEAMQPYALRAKPQSGKIFAGWTGGLTGSDKVLYFTMPDADLQVTATFVENPFSPLVIGKYTGLARGPTAAVKTSGLLTIGVTRSGMATGKLLLGGKSFPVKGEFNGMGKLDTEIKAAKQPKMAMSLQLDLNPNGSQSVAGTITDPAGISTVLAKRAPYDTKKNPLSPDFARSYTFYLPALAPADSAGRVLPSPPTDPDTAPRPQGNGAGVVSISAGGVVKWTGTLGDGSPAVQTTLLDAEKGWPLYLPLYKATGYIAGDVIHDPAAPQSDLSAVVHWVKLPDPKERYFPGGFRIEGHGLTGVNYTPPGKGVRVLAGYDTALGNSGPLVLEEGNLAEGSLGGTLSLLPNNATITTLAVEKLKLSINAKSGAVSGSFSFPVTRQVVPIKGVILQGKIGKGTGVFLGSTLNNNALQTGRFEFRPALP